MSTLIASKIAAFAVAVMMNSVMILGVGYVFNEQSHLRAEAAASVDASQLPDEPA
jgi:hypothetical protein